MVVNAETYCCKAMCQPDVGSSELIGPSTCTIAAKSASQRALRDTATSNGQSARVSFTANAELYGVVHSDPDGNILLMQALKV